eukprot:768369-Hanusia_phi.AAC.7
MHSWPPGRLLFGCPPHGHGSSAHSKHASEPQGPSASKTAGWRFPFQGECPAPLTGCNRVTTTESTLKKLIAMMGRDRSGMGEVEVTEQVGRLGKGKAGDCRKQLQESYLIKGTELILEHPCVNLDSSLPGLRTTGRTTWYSLTSPGSVKDNLLRTLARSQSLMIAGRFSEHAAP